MTVYKAKPIIDDKFWVLEDSDGKRVGTVAKRKSGITFKVFDKSEQFSNWADLSKEHSVSISRKGKLSKPETQTNEIYGYPTAHVPHNAIWNVELHLGLYTKNNKSNCFWAAGYFLVKQDDTWEKQFCPKQIVIQRYPFKGPFKTKEEMVEYLKALNETA
jgi:hypothetical protein